MVASYACDRVWSPSLPAPQWGTLCKPGEVSSACGRAELLEHVRERTPILIHCRFDVGAVPDSATPLAERLLADGCYRNGFEAAAHASFSAAAALHGAPRARLAARGDWERDLFAGAQQSAWAWDPCAWLAGPLDSGWAARDRPRYGELNLFEQPGGTAAAAALYGRSYIDLAASTVLRQRCACCVLPHNAVLLAQRAQQGEAVVERTHRHQMSLLQFSSCEEMCKTSSLPSARYSHAWLSSSPALSAIRAEQRRACTRLRSVTLSVRTYTRRDGAGLATPAHCAHLLLRLPDATLRAALQLVARCDSDAALPKAAYAAADPALPRFANAVARFYVEAHVHGPVRLAQDVAAVVADAAEALRPGRDSGASPARGPRGELASVGALRAARDAAAAYGLRFALLNAPPWLERAVLGRSGRAAAQRAPAPAGAAGAGRVGARGSAAHAGAAAMLADRGGRGKGCLATRGARMGFAAWAPWRPGGRGSTPGSAGKAGGVRGLVCAGDAVAAVSMAACCACACVLLIGALCALLQ